MTFIGKLLVFLLLVLGIGCAVFAAATYTQRPPWFVKNATEGGVDKGNVVYTFELLGGEIDALGKKAVAASRSWGAEHKALEAAEKTREERRIKMFGATNKDGTRTRGLLDYAAEGVDPKDPDSPAFFDLQEKEDPATRLVLLDLDDRTKVVPSPDQPAAAKQKVPLRGTDTLQGRLVKDAAESQQYAQTSVKLRQEQKQLGEQIVLTTTRMAKQTDIRDNLLNEAQYLADFEVNATEQKDTVGRRKAQLLRRLSVFGIGK